MSGCVLGLEEIDQTMVDVVGGKGANLGELSRIEGILVPAGFCVTTDAFRRIMEQASVEPGGRLLIKVLQRLQERKLSLPQPPFEPVFSAQLQFDLS